MEAAGEMAAATATSEAAEAAAVEEVVQAALQQAPWVLAGAATAAATATPGMQEGSAAAAGAEAMEVGEAWAAAPDSCAAGPAVAVWAGERAGRAGILYGIDDGVGVVGLDATDDLPSSCEG
jgi:hypothetical protein